MNNEELKTRVPKPLIPTNNRIRILVLGRIMEECGELIAAASKVLLSGEYAGSTVELLEEEIADVMASCAVAITAFELDREGINERSNLKVDFNMEWAALVRQHIQREKHHDS